MAYVACVSGDAVPWEGASDPGALMSDDVSVSAESSSDPHADATRMIEMQTAAIRLMALQRTEACGAVGNPLSDKAPLHRAVVGPQRGAGVSLNA